MGKFRTDVNLTHQFNTTVGTTYIPNGTNEGDTGLYEHDTADYDGDSVQKFFEVTMLLTLVGPEPVFAETINARLFEKGGSAITGSEVTSGTVGSLVRLRSGDISGNLSGAQELFVQYKTTHASYQCTVSSARLITIQHGNVTKTVISWMIGDDTSAAFGGVNEVPNRRRMLYTVGDYDVSGSATYDFQATARNTGGSTTSIELYNATDASVLATVTTTNSSPTLLQSTGLTPTTAKEYTTRLQRTSPGGTVTIRSAYFVIKLDGSGTALTKLLSPIQILSGFSGGTASSYSTTNNKICGWDVGDYDNVTVATSYESSLRVVINGGTFPTAQTSILEASSINGGTENSTGSTSYIRQRNSYTASSASNVDVDIKGKKTGGGRPAPQYNIASGRILVFLTSITESRRRFNVT